MKKIGPKNLLDQGCNFAPKKRWDSALEQWKSLSVCHLATWRVCQGIMTYICLHLVFTQLDLQSIFAPVPSSGPSPAFSSLQTLLITFAASLSNWWWVWPLPLPQILPCCLSIHLTNIHSYLINMRTLLFLLVSQLCLLRPLQSHWPFNSLSLLYDLHMFLYTYITCTYIQRYIYYMVFDMFSESLYYKLRLAWELQSPGGPLEEESPHFLP